MNIMSGPRRPGSATCRTLLAEWKTRHDEVFHALNAKVVRAKQSREVQIGAGATIAYLLVTGRVLSAAGLAGCWVGSKQIVHGIAGTVACVRVLGGAIAQRPEKNPVTKTQRRRAKPKSAVAPAAE